MNRLLIVCDTHHTYDKSVLFYPIPSIYKRKTKSHNFSHQWSSYVSAISFCSCPDLKKQEYCDIKGGFYEVLGIFIGSGFVGPFR